MAKMEMPARMYRAGQIDSARGPDGAADDDDRRVVLSFSSEEPVARWFGVEILGHNPGEVDLEWLGSGRAPLLLDHQPTLDAQVGVVESAEISGGRGRATVRFGRTARASEILGRVRDGEVTAVSVGYRIDRMELVARDGDDRTYRATRWAPLEVTLCALPADPSVGIGRSAGRVAETVTIEIETTTETRAETMPNDNPAGTETRTAPAASETRTETRAEPRTGPAAEPRRETVEDIRKAEKARVGAIRIMARQFGLPAEMTSRAEDAGTEVAAFQRQVLDHLGNREAEATRAGETRIGLSEREARGFSIMRAVRHLANPNDRRAREAAGFEIEVSQAAEQSLGRSARGILIPADILDDPAFVTGGQRDQTVGTAAKGGDLVATDLLAGAFIPLLRKRTALDRLGIRTLSGLVGNIDIPRQTAGATAYWVGENASPTGSDASFDKVSMTPHTLAAAVSISRRAMLQTTPSVEALVRDDLIRIMALAIDNAGINGSTDTDAPDGLLDATGINAVTFTTASAPSWEEVVELESKIAADDADVEAMRYALAATMRGTLKTTKKDAGSGAFIFDGGQVNGYDAVVSNQIAAGDLLFGNWADLVLGLWSGLDLTVDTAANAASGGIVLRAFQDLDFAVRHDESFARGA